jgi:hypothetical protein
MDFNLMQHGLALQAASVGKKLATVHPIPTSHNIKHMASKALEKSIGKTEAVSSIRQLPIYAVIDDDNGPEAA